MKLYSVYIRFCNLLVLAEDSEDILHELEVKGWTKGGLSPSGKTPDFQELEPIEVKNLPAWETYNQS
jgi:hypothetical protein